MALQAIGVTLLGGFATYLLSRWGNKGGAAAAAQPQGLSVPQVPSTPNISVREPVPAPVEHKPPPAAPVAPVDTATHLPTPAQPPPVTLPPKVPVVAPPVVQAPPVVSAPPVVAPPVVAAPPSVPSPPPAVIETAPPPVAPPPPPDTSSAVPTPPPEVPIELPAASQPPAGFDGALAASLAPAMAKQLASRQYDYDHAALKRFQVAAGMTADGLYGDDTWGALLYFTADAPKALFKPTKPTPYPWGRFVTRAAPAAAQPAAPVVSAPVAEPAAPTEAAVGPVPPAGFDPVLAKKLAKQFAAHLDSKGKLYSHEQLKTFQKAAGIDQDGLYGGGSRRALIFYGIPRPAQPLFKPTATPPTYPWEAQAKAAS